MSDEKDLQILTLQRRLAEAEASLKAAEAKTERAIIEGHLRDAIARTPDLHPAAASDVLRRATETGEWRLNSVGKLMRVSDGQPEITDTGEYVGPRAWISSLRASDPHLFAPTQQPSGIDQNPWAPGKGYSVTKQMEIYRRDPELARRMAAEHGKKI